MTLRGQIFPCLLLLTPFTKGSLRKDMTLGSYGCWVKREPLTVMTTEPPLFQCCEIISLQVFAQSKSCSLSTIGWGWRPPSRHDQAPASQSSRPDPRPTLGLSSLVHVPCCAKPPNTTKILPWAEPRAHLSASERFFFHRVSSCGGPSTMGTERYSSLG